MPTSGASSAEPSDFDVRRHLSGIGAVLAGHANVILQLSRPEIGYAVMNSPVHDGSAMLHPVKRARTTFTYLAVAMLGADSERAAFRRAVNRQHAQVRGAMDPELQLWVAACLYVGTVDVVTRLHGPLGDAEADALYAHCARFGTTLQVPADAWPADRAAFATYWRDGLTRVRIDPPVRDYLLRLARGRLHLFVTTGFLPPELREAMDLAWDAEQQARFDRLVRRAARIERALPTTLRVFPFNALMADLRRRIRRGIPLV